MFELLESLEFVWEFSLPLPTNNRALELLSPQANDSIACQDGEIIQNDLRLCY